MTEDAVIVKFKVKSVSVLANSNGTGKIKIRYFTFQCNGSLYLCDE